MVKLPNDWRDHAFTGGGERLPAGGYVCKITGTEMKLSQKGNEGLVLSFDIAEGQYKDYYQNHESQKWQASLWQNTPNGDSRRDGFFYGMLTAIERSNPGFQVKVMDNGALDETCLEGKYVGVVFRDEEDEYNGVTFFRARPYQIRSVDEIRSGNFKPVEPKTLTKQAPAKPKQDTIPDGFEAIGDDDIPF